MDTILAKRKQKSRQHVDPHPRTAVQFRHVVSSYVEATRILDHRLAKGMTDDCPGLRLNKGVFMTIRDRDEAQETQARDEQRKIPTTAQVDMGR